MTRRTAQQHEVTAGAHEVLGGPLHGMRAGGLVIDGDHDVAQRVLVDNLVPLARLPVVKRGYLDETALLS